MFFKSKSSLLYTAMRIYAPGFSLYAKLTNFRMYLHSVKTSEGIIDLF